MNWWLQAFLLINVALVGAAIAMAIRYALAHYRPEKHDKEHRSVQPMKLPPEERQRLLDAAAKRFEKVLDDSAHQLQLDLARTAEALNKNLQSFGTKIIEEEMKRYRQSLDELQRSADEALKGTKSELETHKAELQSALESHRETLQAKMTEDVAAEQARILKQIDEKLADANATFLLNTLGSNVDLGAQMTYLTDMIEQHKDDFKKEVGSDGKAS